MQQTKYMCLSSKPHTRVKGIKNMFVDGKPIAGENLTQQKEHGMGLVGGRGGGGGRVQ